MTKWIICLSFWIFLCSVTVVHPITNLVNHEHVSQVIKVLGDLKCCEIPHNSREVLARSVVQRLTEDRLSDYHTQPQMNKCLLYLLLLGYNFYPPHLHNQMCNILFYSWGQQNWRSHP